MPCGPGCSCRQYCLHAAAHAATRPIIAAASAGCGRLAGYCWVLLAATCYHTVLLHAAAETARAGCSCCGQCHHSPRRCDMQSCGALLTGIEAHLTACFTHSWITQTVAGFSNRGRYMSAACVALPQQSATSCGCKCDAAERSWVLLQVEAARSRRCRCCLLLLLCFVADPAAVT